MIGKFKNLFKIRKRDKELFKFVAFTTGVYTIAFLAGVLIITTTLA